MFETNTYTIKPYRHLIIETKDTFKIDTEIKNMVDKQNQ